MKLKSLTPYFVWIALVVIIGPYLIWNWRVLNTYSEPEAHYVIAEAFNQLNQVRAEVLSQYAMGVDWTDDTSWWPESELVQLYVGNSNTLGVEFKEHKLTGRALAGTRIEIEFEPNSLRSTCKPGNPSPPSRLLPLNCGGTLDRPGISMWSLAGIALLIVLIRLAVTHLFGSQGVRPLKEDPASLKTLPLGSLQKTNSQLKLTRQLSNVLAGAKVNRHWWQQAVRFSTQSPPLQAGIISKRLKANSSKANGMQVSGLLFNWEFPGDSMVTLSRCRAFFPTSQCTGQRLLDTVTRLSQGNEIVIVIETDDDENQALQTLADTKTNSLVIPTTNELTMLLLDGSPDQIMVQILARQLSLARISPYQTRGGLTRASRFFGRNRELARILDRDLNNYLLIGGRQLGKTSLLKELERRYQSRDDVQTYYLSLRDHRLTTRLAAAADLEESNDLTLVMQRLRQKHPGKQLLIMVDEADLFMRFERQQQYPTLQEIRSLSDENLGHFIFAGFWDLYESAVYDYQSPIRNFGETIRIGALDHIDSRDMVIQPTTQLGLRFASDELVEEIVRGTGRRANLIAIACQQCLDALPIGDQLISREVVQRALHAESMVEALSGWGRLTANAQAGRLDRIIIYKGITGGAVELAAVLRLFATHQLVIDVSDIQQSLMRLQLAFILRKTDVGYSFAVPLFRQQLASEDVELLLAQELEGLKHEVCA